MKKGNLVFLCILTEGNHSLTQIHDGLRQQRGHTGSFLGVNSLAAKH